MIFVADTTLKLVAATAPNATLVAPVNPVPVIVTNVPPAGGPADGEIAVITGPATVALHVTVASAFCDTPPTI